jgi:NhaP-type Na+/H+ or K+/H+ antiporter
VDVALVLAFGLVLMVCVSLSGVAARTVLSTALLFLVAGAVIGPGGLGIVSIAANDRIVALLADVALFTVLFSDGQRANVRALQQNWRLSGRALGLGMPLTMIGIAVPAHFIAGLDWLGAFLLGAILSPTDPVFAAALVGRPDVPLRLRRLLNVESGLNDGIALPFVLIFIATARHEGPGLAIVAGELLLGLLIGWAVPALVTAAWRIKVLTAEPHLQPLGPVAVAVVVYGICHYTHANPYLAAFAAGSTLATLDEVAAHRFEPFGDVFSEATKFAAVLVFGALITPTWLSHVGWKAWLLAALVLFGVRPTALMLSLLGTHLPRRERLSTAWFGPKGFASVVYGLLALQSGIADAQLVFDLTALTIMLSIALHSSTDAPVARTFRIEPPDNLPAGRIDDDMSDRSDETARSAPSKPD